MTEGKDGRKRGRQEKGCCHMLLEGGGVDREEELTEYTCVSVCVCVTVSARVRVRGRARSILCFIAVYP